MGFTAAKKQIQVQQQDLLAQAEGEIATGFNHGLSRILGSGREIRLHGCDGPLPYLT